MKFFLKQLQKITSTPKIFEPEFIFPHVNPKHTKFPKNNKVHFIYSKKFLELVFVQSCEQDLNTTKT